MNQMVSMVGPLMVIAGQQSPRPQGGACRTPACIPGIPQDMFMAMDELVAKPETHGLRPGWSGGTMGMMTIIRVVTPELFEKIEQLKAEQAAKGSAR